MGIVNYFKRPIKKESGKEKEERPKKILPTKACPHILIEPLITEKGSLVSQYQQYFFKASPDATKKQISEAICSHFNVHAQKIRTLNMKGKKATQGKVHGKRKDWKKAIITLKKGEKIEVK